ncbi:hypothetical protein PAEPH01_2294 [Pancytospora epiphaga]|nr:hypothetical protein PAEPH01_2294 [Pancytospora epiphaga]
MSVNYEKKILHPGEVWLPVHSGQEVIATQEVIVPGMSESRVEIDAEREGLLVNEEFKGAIRGCWMLPGKHEILVKNKATKARKIYGGKVLAIMSSTELVDKEKVDGLRGIDSNIRGILSKY